MKRYMILAAGLAACIEPLPAAEAPALLPDPVVVAVSPNVGVPLNSPVRIVFSEPVSAGAIAVARRDGRPVRVETSMDLGELILTPDPAWPSNETLFVTIGDGFETEDGRALAAPDGALPFDTEVGEAPSPRPVIRAPTPGDAAPTNLRFIAVASSPPLPSPLGPAFLDDGDGRVALSVAGRHEHTVLFEVEGTLDAGTTYALLVPNDDVAPADPALTAVTTSTSIDVIAPTVTSTRVTIEGDRLFVDVDADEPIVVHGVAVAEDGRSLSLAPHPMAARQVRLETTKPVPGGTQLAVEVSVLDLAGNEAPPVRVTVTIPPSIHAHISELVPTALHDWSDSEGGDVPFDARPGNGAVTSTDEWIEIVNDSDHPVPLGSAGLEIRTIDRTPAITRVDGAPALYFGDGGSRLAWWPGEALVVRTRGDMSQRDLTVELWSGTVLLDRVRLGEHADADHPGGSPVDTWHESIARDASGRFRWCGPTPGDPLPASGCLE